MFYEKGEVARQARNYLNGLSVSSIMQDLEGGYWFSTLENGVYYMPSNEFLTYYESSGFLDNRVNCVTSDGTNSIFAGLQNGFIHTIQEGNVEPPAAWTR